MRGCRMFVLGLLVILILPGITQAITQLVTYQGLLTNGSGMPITTITTLEFRIYDDSTAGSELWTESQSVIPAPDGLFSVELGSAIPIPDTALSGDEAWLEIKVDTDPPISPRTRLASVPYARIASSVIGIGPIQLAETNLTSGDSGSLFLGRNDASGTKPDYKWEVVSNSPAASSSASSTTTVSADSGVFQITTAQSGAAQASGKRQHKPLTITKEWGATNGSATVEMSTILHVDSGLSENWLYSSPTGTVEGHENGHSFGNGHLDYLKKVSGPASTATAQYEMWMEPDSGVIETTTTESATGLATGRRKHGPITIKASSMTTAGAESAYWERSVASDSGYYDSINVTNGSQSTTTIMKVRPLIKRVSTEASSSGNTTGHESSLSADSGFSETAGMNKSDLITEIAKGTSQTREHVLLSRQVGVPAVATSATLELENTNDGPRITMSREGTSSDPNDDGVIILDVSVPSGVTMTMFLNGDTATTTTAKSDKRKQSLYFPGSLHSALDLLVDGAASMIILKKLNPSSGGVDSNVVIDNNGDMQLAGEMTIGGNQGTVANATTFTVPRITTSQRDALTAVNGMVIYNITTNQFNFYENSAWVTK